MFVIKNDITITISGEDVKILKSICELADYKLMERKDKDLSQDELKKINQINEMIKKIFGK